MAPDDDAPNPERRDEPTVRELLDGASLDSVVDATTQAELAKWFALPSVEVAREQGMELPEDPELVAYREARACARGGRSVDRRDGEPPRRRQHRSDDHV